MSQVALDILDICAILLEDTWPNLKFHKVDLGITKFWKCGVGKGLVVWQVLACVGDLSWGSMWWLEAWA